VTQTKAQTTRTPSLASPWPTPSGSTPSAQQPCHQRTDRIALRLGSELGVRAVGAFANLTQDLVLVPGMPIRLTTKPRVQPHNGAEFAYTGANMSPLRPANVGCAPTCWLEMPW